MSIRIASPADAPSVAKIISRANQAIAAKNDLLKNWYETLGFTPFEKKTFNHLPFDVLLMQCPLDDLKGGAGPGDK